MKHLIILLIVLLFTSCNCTTYYYFYSQKHYDIAYKQASAVNPYVVHYVNDSLYTEFSDTELSYKLYKKWYPDASMVKVDCIEDLRLTEKKIHP